MTFTVSFDQGFGMQSVDTDLYQTAFDVAYALRDAGFNVLVYNNTYNQIEYSYAPPEPALIPISNCPRCMHQRQGFPTGDRINIAKGTLRPEFERDGAIDRPAFAPAGSMRRSGYTEVRIG